MLFGLAVEFPAGHLPEGAEDSKKAVAWRARLRNVSLAAAQQLLFQQRLSKLHLMGACYLITTLFAPVK
jgi:hypothetical protein